MAVDVARYAALFAAEAREQVARALRAAAAPGAPGATDEAFRAVHTIKGMAAAMGYAATEAAADAAERALAAARSSFAPPADLAALLDALAAAVERDAADGGPPAPTRLDTVRVDAARLDALLDLTGDLAGAGARLAAAAAGATDPALARAVLDVSRAAQALQAAVLHARLVPLGALFERLPRLVREAARAAGRHVAFEARGGDVAVDRGVADALAEPLTHLLRNAVDHGVEPAAERRAAAKPAAGRIVVEAVRTPAGVELTVSDDGRGVDRAAVLAAARRRGDVGDEVAGPLDDRALLAVLARPGLSTAAAAGRLSGRGVGVDAAVAAVAALGGTVTLDTEAGRGTRFTLRVPVAAAVVPLLLVRAGGVRLGLPLGHVRGTRAAVTGEAAPRLDALLGLPPLGPAAPNDVIALDGPAGRFEVAVDAVDGLAEPVVKPMPALRGAFRTAAAATILDGGEVAPVLDVPALAARLPAPALP